MALSKLTNRVSTQVSNFKERIEARRLAKDSNRGYITPDLRTAIKQRGIRAVIEELEHSYYLRTDKKDVTLTLGKNRKTYTGLTAEKLRYGKLRRISLASGLRQKTYSACLQIIGDPRFTNKIMFGSGIKTRRYFLETISKSILTNEERFWRDMNQIVGIKANKDGTLIINVYDSNKINPGTKTKPKPRTTFEVQLNIKEIKQFYDYTEFTQNWHNELNEYRQGVWEIK